MGLPFPKARITQTTLPFIFFMCIAGTLSPSTVCKKFDWADSSWLADPQVLSNQVPFTKSRSQRLNVPASIDLSVVFNSLLNHLISPEGGVWCVKWHVIQQPNVLLFGPDVYEVILEMSTVVWLNSFWGAISSQDLLFKRVSGSGMWHGIHFQPDSWVSG